MSPKNGPPTSPKPSQDAMQKIQNYGHFSEPRTHKSASATPQNAKNLPKKSSSMLCYNGVKIIKTGATRNGSANSAKRSAQVVLTKCKNNVSNRSMNTTKNSINMQEPKVKTSTNLVEKYIQKKKSVQNSNGTNQTKVFQNLLPKKDLKTEVNNQEQCEKNKANVVNNQKQCEKNKSNVVNNQKQQNEKIKTNETPKDQSSSKDILQLYSRTESINSTTPTLLTKPNSPPISTENRNFLKVTQELATIIKNFQRHKICSAIKMDDLPPEILQPKIKEFFKSQKKPTGTENARSKSQTNSTNKTQSQNLKNSNSKDQTNSTNKITSQTRVFNNQTSFSLSRHSIPSRNSNLRRLSTSAHNGLQTKYTSSRIKITDRASSLGLDPLKALREEVQKAMREKKTFTIRGLFAPVRKALLARGWVEKYHISYKAQLNDELQRYVNFTISELMPLTRREDIGYTCRNLVKSKLLTGHQVDFYWGMNHDVFKENPDKIKLTIINKLKNEINSYTNKQGLCDASKSSYWYQINNVSKLNHPRTYNLSKNEDTRSFIDDFHITAAMSLLKWVVKVNKTKECKIVSPTGKIPLETFDFALNECCKVIKRQSHEDIDIQIPDASENEWNQFLDYFYKIVQFNNHFKADGSETEDSVIRKSEFILEHLRNLNPYVDMDGMMNVWILKPIASSRGRGIYMCRTLQFVLKVIKQNVNIRYIIQKYIERPLLIYNTKFDIRQWFLISNCSPITIWMYKECYLRFSSQTYNLRKLHESIHLTNNSVQSNYKNKSLDAALPSYNMWDSIEFRTYLTNIGYPTVFKDIIYPGMRQCITATVLMHQDKMVIRKNCFELYGADFMLTENFQPWLLEINSSPALGASTPVTAKMCPQVLQDVIKVVIDHAHNSNADTGLFEMIYKEKLTNLPPSSNLELKGLPLPKDYFCSDSKQIVSEPVCNTTYLAGNQGQDYFKMFSEEIKQSLKNLLEIIHNEKLKRERLYRN